MGRITRWILRLMEYDFEIVYRPGRLNGNADSVSRIPNLQKSLVVTMGLSSSQEDFLREQSLDQDIVDKWRLFVQKGQIKIVIKSGRTFVLGKMDYYGKI